MPTGYTCIIEEGCSFEEYAWRCARAFGALVVMREEGLDVPVPERFEPSDYHPGRIAEFNKELFRIGLMTRADVESAVKAEIAEAQDENHRYAVEHERQSRLYEAMRARVEAWEPPSPDHREMKAFMLEQIDISRPDHLYQRPIPESDPDSWLASKKAKTLGDLAYHQEELGKEIVRTNERNRWVALLRGSIPQPVARATLEAEA